MIRDPFIPTEGIHNLRDFGGWKTHEGGSVRTGLLWRSGQHVDLIGAFRPDMREADDTALTTLVEAVGAEAAARAEEQR